VICNFTLPGPRAVCLGLWAAGLAHWLGPRGGGTRIRRRRLWYAGPAP